MKLELLFNVALVAGGLPVSLQRGRTILIPKTDEGLERVDNRSWRPITVKSVITRICNKIIEKRLTNTITLHHNQSGFIDRDGVLLNTALLDSLIKEKRTELKEHHLVSIDLKGPGECRKLAAIDYIICHGLDIKLLPKIKAGALH